MWDRTAYVYAPGDDLGVGRQPSRDFVPSPWVATVMEAATGSAVALTAAIALAVIFLLGRRK